MENEEKLKHISASQISLYAECSYKYKFRYIDRIDKPAKSVHLAYGTAIHKAMEKMNKDGGDLIDMYQAYHDMFRKESEEMDIDWQGFYEQKLYYMGLHTLEKYYANFSDYECLESESQFTVPIIYPDGTTDANYTFHGIIDLIGKRDKKTFILDYKTAKEAYKPFKIKTNIQLALYAYAFRQLIKEGKFHTKTGKEDYTVFHVLVKDYENMNGDIIENKKIVKDEDIRKMLNIVRAMIRGIQNEVFLPNYQDSCQFCEYKKECLES